MTKDKAPEVRGAEITDDGCIIIEFNKKLYPHTSKCIFAPEILWQLAQRADIPSPDEQSEDFPGLPVCEGDIEESEEEQSKPERNGKKGRK